jgi:hypothetical protein
MVQSFFILPREKVEVARFLAFPLLFEVDINQFIVLHNLFNSFPRRWGINEQMKKRALKFEEAGFRTILPDLYHGKSAAIGKTEEAKHLYSGTIHPLICYSHAFSL